MDKHIILCNRCEIAATCLLDYDGVPCRKNRTVEPTNGDLLRSMTDEELAEWIASITKDAIPDWLAWLKQEALLPFYPNLPLMKKQISGC